VRLQVLSYRANGWDDLLAVPGLFECWSNEVAMLHMSRKIIVALKQRPGPGAWAVSGAACIAARCNNDESCRCAGRAGRHGIGSTQAALPLTHTFTAGWTAAAMVAGMDEQAAELSPPLPPPSLLPPQNIKTLPAPHMHQATCSSRANLCWTRRTLSACRPPS
jgi:hypothetical protein